MGFMKPEIIEHMLEASEPAKYSVLLQSPAAMEEFLRWCQESSDASRIIESAKDEIHTFPVEPGSSTYCIAMSVDTLGRIVRGLTEEFEDLWLEELISR
jgi:hypothetical protein